MASYRFCFLWFCPLTCTEFVSRALFVFVFVVAKFLLFRRLFRIIWFSLLFFMPLLTWTRVAWSNRSFKASPMTRKFGKRIQQVFTEQDPDIPWHLHSSRISACTCWNNKEKDFSLFRSIIFERYTWDVNRWEATWVYFRISISRLR